MNAGTPISIWQPGVVDSEAAFVRPDPLPLGDHYSDRKFFRKNKTPGRRRICFFGESAAAGYLYAPHVTPAKVLDHLLGGGGESAPFEVIDLARTNETLHGLVATVEAAMQLGPDVLVVFTGNNWTMLESPEWSPYTPSVAARQEYGRRLRDGGLSGVVEAATWRVLELAAAAFARIDVAARAVGARVVVVVPEVNLGDWHNRQAPPWLPADGTARWHTLYRQAVEALGAAQWSRVEEIAWQMEALDGCLCPTTYRLLAESYRRTGQMHRARLAAEAEVDSNRYATLCFLGAPQINSGFKNLQRRLARQYGFATVDLPEIFARHTQNAWPDRRLFLDYCHLTLEGMAVAAAAIAAEIVSNGTEGAQVPDWKALLLDFAGPAISPEADAAAKFGAAIHTAHRHLAVGPATDILEYWCREALRASPGVEQAMADFYTMRLTRIPAVLTAAQHDNFASAYRLTMQHGLQYEYPDAPLLGVLERVLSPSVLAAAGAGAPGFDTIDLLEAPPALYEPVERFYPETMPYRDVTVPAFFRAAWPTSTFVWRAPAGAQGIVELTVRLPAIPGWPGRRSGTVLVCVDDRWVGAIDVDSTWTKASFPVRQPLPAAGHRRLTLHWPALPPCGDEALPGAAARLEKGLEADVHPVFGEVFSIRIRPFR